MFRNISFLKAIIKYTGVFVCLFTHSQANVSDNLSAYHFPFLHNELVETQNF